MIYDLEHIDLMGRRRDGGIELYIIPPDKMDDSAETQESLLDKVERYLGYIRSQEFFEEFGSMMAGQIWIVLKLPEEPSYILKELCQRIIPWVEDNGAKFRVVVDH